MPDTQKFHPSRTTPKLRKAILLELMSPFPMTTSLLQVYPSQGDELKIPSITFVQKLAEIDTRIDGAKKNNIALTKMCVHVGGGEEMCSIWLM